MSLAQQKMTHETTRRQQRHMMQKNGRRVMMKRQNQCIVIMSGNSYHDQKSPPAIASLGVTQYSYRNGMKTMMFFTTKQGQQQKVSPRLRGQTTKRPLHWSHNPNLSGLFFHLQHPWIGRYINLMLKLLFYMENSLKISTWSSLRVRKKKERKHGYASSRSHAQLETGWTMLVHTTL